MRKLFFLLGTVSLLSFYAGQATNSPDLTNWNFLVQLGSVLSGIGAIGTLIIAYCAIIDWKRHLTNNIVISTAIEVEDKATLFYLAILNEPTFDELSKEADLQLFKEINLLSIRLRRRNFSVNELKRLEEAMSNVVDFVKPGMTISNALSEEVRIAIDEFSKTF